MRIVPNPKPTIAPGMKLRLKDGDKVPIDGHLSYKWEVFETVDYVNEKVIMFKNYPDTTWFTTDMDWEIKL